MVEGYAGCVSAVPGEAVGLFLSGGPGPVTLTVRRHAGPESANVAAHVAPQPVPANAWAGYGWPQTVAFQIPATWPSGYYRVYESGAEVAGFVVRPTAPGTKSKVLVSVDMITSQAYNDAGGKSLYFAGRASIVSYNRPGGLPNNNEIALHQWLAAQGIAVEYCASPDLGLAGFLDNYECLVIAGHAEYWTRAMYERVAAFVAGGGNVVCLSGNTCYRQVRLEGGGRTLVFHKYAGNDPAARAPDVTVAFAEPPVNRSQAALLGVGFTHAAWRGAGGQWAPYQLRFPNHWAMAGVAARQTQPFLNYETDAAAYVEEPEGYPRVTGEEGTPSTFVLLGTADLRDSGWEKPGAATMGVYRRNGTVFAAGSTDWVGTLTGQPGFPNDPAVVQITKNVMARLSKRVPADWEEVGHANGPKALTAVGTRLFLATGANRLWRRHPVAADVPWREVGHANNIVALASDGDVLFGLSADNKLWWRSAIEADVTWAPLGPGVGGTTLAFTGGFLYATDSSGRLHRRPARRVVGPAWQPMAASLQQQLVAMAGFADILFGTTSGGRLVRTNNDFIAESTGWTDIHHCNYSVGLAAVDASLFVVTSQNKLWWMDLRGLRKP